MAEGAPKPWTPCVPLLHDKGWRWLSGSERALPSQHCDMNAGNFSTIQKQLLFSKNLRHASLGELHSIPPTMAVATCGGLGCKPGESPPEGEAAAHGLEPCCHCSSGSVPGLFMLGNTIPAPSQTSAAAKPFFETGDGG